jgi:hypothetical protein
VSANLVRRADRSFAPQLLYGGFAGVVSAGETKTGWLRPRRPSASRSGSPHMLPRLRGASGNSAITEQIEQTHAISRLAEVRGYARAYSRLSSISGDLGVTSIGCGAIVINFKTIPGVAWLVGRATASASSCSSALIALTAGMLSAASRISANR